jgi:hypothetical protein
MSSFNVYTYMHTSMSNGCFIHKYGYTQVFEMDFVLVDLIEVEQNAEAAFCCLSLSLTHTHTYTHLLYGV